MARKKGDIGAEGSATARLFHPKAPLEVKYGKGQLSKVRCNAIIMGKVNHKVRHTFQMCYEVRIPDINDHNKFVIVCSNFKVTTSPQVLFDDKVKQDNCPAREDSDSNERGSCTEENNITTAINHRTTTEDIDELHAQGIEVENEGPAPENIAPPTVMTLELGQCEDLRTCPRKADPNATNVNGKFISKTWTQIGNMDELSLIRPCFPEEYIIKILIPSTNKHIKGDLMTLHEFYIVLGCRFFMACFYGISDYRLWWSKKPINTFEGAPFRLNKFITHSRFSAITEAIR